jgi:Mg-chelatase subunit ChlD
MCYVLRCGLAGVVVLTLLAACDSAGPGSVGRVAEPPRVDPAVDEALAGGPAAEAREGLAAAIVIDVSGSMNDRVPGEDGRRVRKIEVARRAARNLIEQFVAYAEAHPVERVQLGIFEFSRRSGQPDCRPVVPMGPPDRNAVQELAYLTPEGGTPIGSAMIAATHALDATGASRRHLLLVTDGENTDGFRPEEVAAGIARRPAADQPSIYFVAFDVDARRFDGVRDAGGLVLPAANARELNETLHMLLTDSILVER